MLPESAAKVACFANTYWNSVEQGWSGHDLECEEYVESTLIIRISDA